jgi:hypothetical protein
MALFYVSVPTPEQTVVQKKREKLKQNSVMKTVYKKEIVNRFICGFKSHYSLSEVLLV